MADTEKTDILPCNDERIALRDYCDCPNYGSSDCPKTFDSAECTMTIEKLENILSYR